MRDLKAFISYSHKDKRYFKLLVDGLKSHSRNSNIFNWNFWDDRDILIGSDWHENIQNQVNECNFAILLISSDFLSSEYVKQYELENFIQFQSNKGFLFFPVLIRDCDFNKIEKIAKVQFFVAYGEEYGLPKKENVFISYSELVRYDTEGALIPNPYCDTFHKNLVKAIEKVIERELIKKLNPNDSLQIYENALSFFTVVDNASFDIVINKNKLVLLFVDECRVTQITYILLKIKDQFKSHLKVYYVNATINSMIPLKHGTTILPSILFFANGNLVEKLESDITEFRCFDKVQKFIRKYKNEF